MPTKAFRSFEQNRGDVDRLLEIHEELAGTAKGRKYGVEPLNKAAIVLVCAIWEAYVEDVVAELLDHLMTHVEVDRVPKELRKRIADEIRSDRNESSPWNLAGDKWREFARQRLVLLQTSRNIGLNTPKFANVDALFVDACGLKNMSHSWRWQKTNFETAQKKLDEFVTLRGAIAHRSVADDAVQKVNVTEFFALIQRLVEKTDQCVNAHAKKACSPLFIT